ncbi:MAG: tRNA 2-thiouridine(34) synthase MnmA [Polyangia bacterium]
MFARESREKKVLVASSGGVDSAVAALLLAREGLDVVGWWMRATGDASPLEARRAAARLGIELVEQDVRDRFDRDVVAPSRASYHAGRTPNPCALCNSRLKLKMLVEAADRLGCDRVASGHYARIEMDSDGAPRLLRGRDRDKDQSYFLFALERAVLDRLVFPLGELDKTAVREIAKRENLPARAAQESQDCCFDPSPPDAGEPGEIVDPKGRFLKRHEGMAGYTVGQRRGLGVAGGRRLYVVGLEPERRRVVLGPSELLLGKRLVVSLKGFGRERVPDRLRASCRIRHRHRAAPAEARRIGGDRVEVIFDEPQRAITPGQAAVLYDGDEVLGGGWIEEASLSGGGG